jgi:hypothetical protein
MTLTSYLGMLLATLAAMQIAGVDCQVRPELCT